jgi:hypothetical protein
MALDDGESGSPIDWVEDERRRLRNRLLWWALDGGAAITSLRRFPDIGGFDAYPYASRLAAMARALDDAHGNGRGSAFFAELFPLSRAAVLEFGSDHVLSEYRGSKNVFSVVRIWERLRLLRAIISQYTPQLVYMYGRSDAGRWEEVGSLDESCGRQGRIEALTWWRTDATVFVVSPTPSRAAMPGRTIARLPLIVVEAFEAAGSLER